MYFLLSGEGPTDIGICKGSAPECEGDAHEEGPMTIFVSQIVERQTGVSFMETGHYGYVSKSTLVAKVSAFKQRKKSPRLPGKKRPKETAYFHRNARALAICAKEKEIELKEHVVAVLFRDSDGTASADRGLWQDKQDSMIQGFADKSFRRGVAMIPKPKSEAWIICAVKRNPYQGCEALENRSGNDKSPNSLKGELAGILNGPPSRESLCDLVNNGTIDNDRIDMPSFHAFRRHLEQSLQLPSGN